MQILNNKPEHQSNISRDRTLKIGTEQRSARLTVAQVAEICHVHRRTAQRWIRSGRPPRWAQELIQHKVLGRLPGKVLSACYAQEDAIVTPHGRIPAETLLGLTYVMQERSALRVRIMHLESDIARLKAAIDGWRRRAGAPMAVNQEK